ncbi:MAG: bifunctional methylenetetrahydrofolate dehydrogenase/methenyltetrahydrofolate cyclohydrolase FolD [Candidatus Margulisbacteria bacterium]|nr:bifunctional methylenetetrahydrofolate dehydrogenase/methenyltetrahydrofolate cyclohydrolase FolD [Candidatus Margulisiibacteriota bacterium]
MVKIIDGKEEAARIREEIRIETEELKREKRIAPGLRVILVGDDPASQAYVRNKEKASAEAGIDGQTLRYPASITENELISVVKKLNSDPVVDGLLVQLPLPKGMNTQKVLDAISYEKDVDGLSPLNMGKLLRGENPLFVACTPKGIMHLILSTGIELKGKEAVVVGRSNIVGKPMALLLLEKHATVTICHSRTKDLGEVCRRADVLVAAVGFPELIKGDMVKDGAIVIDVGTNRVDGKWVGDVEFEPASKRASFITPVPGGVGPMTIAMLLENTLIAAKRRAGII